MNQALLLLTFATAFGQNPPASLAVQVGGKPVGARNTLNLIPGTGMVQTCVDNASQNRVDCSSSYNFAVVATHDTVYANETYCHSSTGTAAYACRLQFKALTRYQTGMTFLLDVDTTCTRSCTLSIDSLGPVNLKRNDGATDPGGALTAGQPQWVFYDGRVFRLMGEGATAAVSSGPQDTRGDVTARRLIGAMNTMAYAARITLDVTAGDLHKTTTSNSVGDATINAATRGLPGQHMWIIVQNDEISGKTVTFGDNFRSAGALQGVAGKAATLHFVSDGTSWYEVSRTRNL
jgi:hypothetical protein